MAKYIAHWYDQDSEKVVDPKPIIANNQQEAEAEAYRHYNGNPPAPMVWLEEVK